MEGLFILMALALLAIMVGGILGWVAFARTGTLRRELDDVLARLRQVEAGGAVAVAAPPAPAADDAPAPDSPVAEPVTADGPVAAAGSGPDPAASATDTPEAEAPSAEAAVETAAPAARRDLEEAIGTRWSVWIGGLALALGGIFLARYSIEAGLIGPAARVAAGLAFALALLAAGEWMRRRGHGLTTDRAAYVPAILTAAGTVGAFASIYSAHALYGFIGSGTAVLALGAVAVGTMLLALLHGMTLGALGLLGAYASPVMVTATEPNYPGLATYLVAVTVSALGVARIARWRWLAVAASLVALLWMWILCLDTMFDPQHGPVLALYAAAVIAVVHIAFALTIHPRDPGLAAPHDLVALAVLSAMVLAVVVHAGFVSAADATLALAMAVSALYLVTAYERPALRAIAIAPGVAVVVAVAFLPTPFPWIVDPIHPQELLERIDPLLEPDARRVIFSALAIALFYAVAGLFGTLGSAARVPLAVAGSAVPVALGVVAYLQIGQFQIDYVAGFAMLGLAGYLAVTTETLVRRLPAGEFGVDGAIAAYAVAAVAAVAAGLAMMTERGVLTVTLALIVPAIAFIEAARPAAGLRQVALAVAALVVLRFLADPAVVGEDLGTTPFFNWLLWGYGVPAGAFAVAAVRFGRTRQDLAVHVFEALAVTFLTLTAVMLIHHWLTGGDIEAPVSGLLEQGLHTLVLLCVSLGLQWLARRRASPVFAFGTLVAGALGVASAVGGLLFVQNPLISGEPVTGGAFDGKLVFGYLLPAALALAVSALAHGRADRPLWYVRLTGAAGGVLAFAFVTLAVRAAWHSGDLVWPDMAEGELYAYSAVWLAYALVALAAGGVLGIRVLRLAAGVIALGVIAKVFLVDTAGLTGALRAASFIGLGLVLMAVGLAYQRVMRKAG